MKKAFKIGTGLFAVYGLISLIGGIAILSKADKWLKTEEKKDVVRENGKTYFTVQDTEHDETQPMGFHLQ